MTSARDQILGCILGGAVGDIIGGKLERNQLCLSDDTQLTLATCESITATGSVEPSAIANSFLRWFRTGALTGLGSATLKALRDLDAGGHWALCGARGEMAASNGAAMRIAPLAFAIDPFDPKQRVTVRDVCRITHHNDEAYIGALAVLLSLRLPANITPPAFRFIADELPDSLVRDRLIAFGELPLDTPIREASQRFGSSGFVVETVPLALLIAARMTSGTFEAVLNELVDSGGDTDTIGSIAGQIAGAQLGLSGLPNNLANLREAREIIPIVEAFANCIVAKRPLSDDSRAGIESVL